MILFFKNIFILEFEMFDYKFINILLMLKYTNNIQQIFLECYSINERDKLIDDFIKQYSIILNNRILSCYLAIRNSYRFPDFSHNFFGKTKK